MEKVLWLIERVKSGLRSFMREISSELCSMVRQTSWSWQRSNRDINWDQSTLFSTQEIADILKISKSSTENHLHQLDYVNHFDVCVSHELSEKNLLDHISACDPLLKHNENVPFLKQIVKGDGKWILYNKVEWKRSWTSKMNHHQPHQRPVFIQRRWCCVYGGTGRESSIMSSFQKTKWLIPTSSAPN